ncbi:GNAT family N-acetyltransferase [Xanthomonas rydalmerensis]|uniref:GNAT family N-acetyltransferase n=1 Tax=Xanthomonas rydalmerensis TaxID=3046274 RepID=A0ABZ0JP67_9XANT|nr:GNAT family N-acetyltransferase [Xanthomonas sp. DM-2023]WOS41601.1 GNAT family N-acetyltransferase [Xanthomonas sp. DM-2023]WOS45787.1 GNAT family N-acetyltransferase [Xanthomonas sp. DM-2023]WOS49966.1 GNAT family N-acetyltransferase [Xanthomonas sp. DM-2023]WOS54145.1 GNAT family N-acetyltransferase [Xanthomonas sp. DM-2023]WOS58328.1 GNAT family N-acetyltransferase [Xanthomonas sp. DM-2023]
MLTYREATASDLPAICALGEEVNALHHAASPHIFAGPGAADRDAAHWTRSIGQNDATTFVAEAQGVLVGFVTVGIVVESHSLLQPMRFGRVGSVGITRSHRGQGIGPALMQRAHDWVARRGGVEMRLNVWAFNRHALHVYEELGYDVRSLTLVKPLTDDV